MPWALCTAGLIFFLFRKSTSLGFGGEARTTPMAPSSTTSASRWYRPASWALPAPPKFLFNMPLQCVGRAARVHGGAWGCVRCGA